MVALISFPLQVHVTKGNCFLTTVYTFPKNFNTIHEEIPRIRNISLIIVNFTI